MGALDGLRVLECTSTTAAAYCAKLLADLGADVVKVESPEGDPARRAGPFPPDDASPETSGRFLYLNTSKRSVVLSASSDEDRSTLGHLARSAHVVIDDEPRSALGQVLDPVPDGLVWCTITPFGLTGPYRHYKAQHLTIAHAGGEGHVLPGGVGWQMFPDRPPVQIGGHAALLDAGADAAIAVLGAWFGRVRTGRGERIDVSAQEAQVGMFRTRLVRFTHDGVVVHQRANPYTSAGGMFLCADGYVQILGPREESWADLTGVPGGEVFEDERFGSLASRTTHVDELNDVIASWCAGRTKAEIVSVLGPIGFAVGAYAVPKDLVESPQLRHRQFFQTVAHPRAGEVQLPGVPYQLSATPVRLRPAPLLGSGNPEWEPTTPEAPVGREVPGGGPLAGVRVLDFTWAIAGPYATMLLAFLGAEVIKVESSSRPDVMRRGISGKDYGGINRSPDFQTLNLQKRSLRLDLSQPGGREVIDRLLEVCDIVIDNFRPGVMQRLGLGPDDLLRRFPSLVVASSSGNGSTGPEALFAGLASIFAAVGGMSEQTGYPDAPPTLIGESPDFRSGNLLAVAVLAALAHRQRTGQGQFIDFSSREAMTCLAPDSFLAYTLGAADPGRTANADPAMAPHNVYRCRGEHEWLSVAVSTDDEWRALCSVLGHDDLAERHPDGPARKAAEAEIDAVVAGWAKDRPAADAFVALQEAGVPAAPSFTNADLVADPHLGARGVFVRVDHPEIGDAPVPGTPWQLSRWPAPDYRPAPLLGADNDYVLASLLGLSAGEIARLGDVFT